MTILTCPFPENVNPLNPNGFLFSVQKLPEVTFFAQEVELPSISIGTITQASSVHDIKIPGETAEYGSLTLSFLVDEEFKNWKAIYAWMIGLSYPQNHEVYTRFLNSAKNANSYSELAKGYSDASLTILDSSNNPIQNITFVDAFPTSLSSLPFTSTNTDVNYMRASVTFDYTYYTLL
jgi:T4-like virus tail tube protein gp19